MLDDVEIDPAKLDADILFDVPDDELERVATVAGGQAVTVGVQCTFWYHCGWPLSRTWILRSWRETWGCSSPGRVCLTSSLRRR